MPKAQELTISRVLSLLILAMTAEASNTFLFAYTLTNIADDFRLTWATTALLGFGPQITGVIGGQFIGLIADTRGRRVGLAASILLSALGALATGLSSNVWEMVTARMISGLTLAGTWTACTTLINETVPEYARGRGTAMVQVGFPLGNLLCSALVVLFSGSWGWRGTFLGLALILFICGVLVVLWIPESKLWSDNQLREKKGFDRGTHIISEIFSRPFRRNTLIAIVISIFCVLGGFSIHTGIPTLLLNIGFRTEEIPNWSALVWAVAAVGYSSFGFIADRFGHKRVFLIFLLGAFATSLLLGTVIPALQGLGALGLAQALSIGFLAVIMYFTGFFSGIGVLYSSLFPVRIRATAIGLTFNAGRIGNALSPYISRVLSERVGFGNGLILSTLPLLAASMVVLALPDNSEEALVRGLKTQRGN